MQRLSVDVGGAVHKSARDESVRVHEIPPRLLGDVQERDDGHLLQERPDAPIRIPRIRGCAEADRRGRELWRKIAEHQAQIPTHSCHQLRSPRGHREQPQPSRYVLHALVIPISASYSAELHSGETSSCSKSSIFNDESSIGCSIYNIWNMNDFSC